MIGTTLAHYRVTGALGSGGMGEVYRATDTRLDREVAVKVLPGTFTTDPERLARFAREAQLLAQLQHPNIAAVYGLEEWDGRRALVMELVEGEDLAARTERGPLPLDEALPIARQIAEALEAAHERGIVHRDLKPANVKLRSDGTVKVLDFGLAKAMEPASGGGTVPDLAHSPTLTAAHGTQLGVVLGTAAYMAPEQARGAAVDKRCDVWAFGVVLYEMLTGKRLFEGETVSDTLAAVLRAQIEWSALPAATPPALRTLLRRCLERNPKNRLHDIADARIALEDLAAGGREDGGLAPPATVRRSGVARWLPWGIAAAAVLAAAAAWLLPRGERAAAGAGGVELALAAPRGVELAIGSNRGWGVVSPDGRQVVFPVNEGGSARLWIRSLDRPEGRPLPGTEDGFYPFWSPDSRWVAFFVSGALFKIEVAGGLPERICAAAFGRGGSWSPSGWILFSPIGGGVISRVRADGGEPAAATALDEARGEDAHYWPIWLPDGSSFLYFIRSGRRENQGIYLGRIVAGGVDRERRRLVASASSGLFAPPAAGREATLLWAREDRLLARAFDPAAESLSGPVFEVVRGVRVNESQRATMASVSTTGTLVYASSEAGRHEIHVFDRSGRDVGALPIPPGDVHGLTMSAGGKRLAFIRAKDGQGDVWVHDLASGTTRALTSSAEYDESPTWSSDGSELLFRAGLPSRFRLMRARADGETAPRPQPLAWSARPARPTELAAWPADEWILATVLGPQGEAVVAVGLGEGDRAATSFTLSARPIDSAQYSSSARALAFVSSETGSSQGFVVSIEVTTAGLAPGGDRQRIPLEGARAVRWRKDGGELYAIAADGALWAIPVYQRDGPLRLGTVVKLFEGSFVSADFDVDDSGERFLFRVDPAAERQTLGVVLDWPARLAETPR